MLDRTRNFPNPSHHTMHVPRTMFAAAIDRFGGPEVITAHALPVPEVDAGEVLIAVDTAGVGRWDADVREGFFASRKPHFPLVLGYDGAGIIAKVGSRVRRLRVGDEVYSYNWENKDLFRPIKFEMALASAQRCGPRAKSAAGVIDSQSAKTTESSGPGGYDAAQKIKAASSVP